ncbi:MoaD/ThiS family protein [Acidipropionibacterium acidipropionici]|jgi:molybdopterin converting factor small subunit|uniref:MoaD/ThiS family protein n=1 Tax=Acidipropionibacterium acidipropionici TaxID=1748 RepID=UPI0003F978CB|nr:MoaD/ThiS family protein [Acidipropionibacterium acidipropionici]ALN14526.1 molybdopterin synthase sulfur carrier subunit [Acidipropionibacterium acidipropionici]APZ09714.1 molybdopterin synthase sulfur carrier subunit [Acidipropionibacterium acidipropionici]QCV96267.1 MoaD/ThiS family protein [Acidipropionibacterium acidipropionici]
MIVHYYGGAAEAAGTPEEGVDAVAGESVGELADRLVSLHPGLARTMPVCSFFLDGSAARRDAVPAGDSRVDVLPPFAGG